MQMKLHWFVSAVSTSSHV